MRRWWGVIFAALLMPIMAQAQSPIPSLPTIGTNGSTYPLPDPSLTPQWIWMTQSIGGTNTDFKIDPFRLGGPFVGAVAPAVPYTYQEWWNISINPPKLEYYTGSAWQPLLSATGLPIGSTIFPSVATNAALKGLATNGGGPFVIRMGVNTSGDAPPLTFKASNSPCSLNGGNGDTGSQVKSADGNCWVALHTTGDTTASEWGVVADGVTDNGPQTNAALAFLAGTGQCLQFTPSAGIYAFSTSITPPTSAGSCIDGLTGMPTHLQVKNAANINLITAPTTGVSLIVKNIQLDGNGTQNPTGGSNIDAELGSQSVTLDNVWSHDATQSGAYFNGTNGFYVYGGGYYNNGHGVPSFTNNGAGINIGSGAENFQIYGTQAYTNATTGIGCLGTCQKGEITGNIANNNGAGQEADDYTGYSAANNHLLISNNLSVSSGNNGIHFGGNYITYSGNIVESPAEYGIVHLSKATYTTGTVSCNGTTTITGLGTSWSGLLSFNGFYAQGLGGQITIGSTTYPISLINNNTSLTVIGGSCPTVSGQSYTLSGYVQTHDVTITGGSVTNAHLNAIWMDQVSGGSITGVTNKSGPTGFLLTGTVNVTVNGNSIPEAGVGVDLDGDLFYPTSAVDPNATVIVNQGSAAVIGLGTHFSSWVTVGSIFQILNDTTNYVVQSVSDDTHLTLAIPYAGVGVTSAFAIVTGPPLETVVVGNSLGGGGNCIVTRGSTDATIASNDLTHCLNGINGAANSPGTVEFGDLIGQNNCVLSTNCVLNVNPINNTIIPTNNSTPSMASASQTPSNTNGINNSPVLFSFYDFKNLINAIYLTSAGNLTLGEPGKTTTVYGLMIGQPNLLLQSTVKGSNTQPLCVGPDGKVWRGVLGQCLN
jgi:hypothetical protein